MVSRIKIVGMIGAISIMYSCASNEFTTSSGVKVSYIKKGAPTDSVANTNQIMSLNIKWVIEKNNKELFNTSKNGIPMGIQCDTTMQKNLGKLYDVFSLLKKGDSVSFSLTAEDFYEKTIQSPLPDSVVKTDFIKFYVGVENILSREEFQQKQEAFYQQQRKKEQEMAQEMNIKDGVTIDEYLKQQNITAQTTPSQLRYVITKEGTGEKASAGKRVLVHYSGYLLDGTKFDASYDRNEPFEFILGAQQVITGWDEGIALLNKGAKATLYIPSGLGYGSRGAGGVIPPNAILKFDVELLEIK
ncbi:MAG: FKBP-type peptidyl-prolyl cis-trans isomerase [Chitinophagaceae bacterium]|nr:FKBP-type peptidyl-prolyl cis-trans isomerase [Chitinophagaceae bacterium]